MERVARALADRIEEVRSAECRRLRRKIASLAVTERTAVEMLVEEVIRRIAWRASDAVRRLEPAHAAGIVERLFSLPPEPP